MRRPSEKWYKNDDGTQKENEEDNLMDNDNFGEDPMDEELMDDDLIGDELVEDELTDLEDKLTEDELTEDDHLPQEPKPKKPKFVHKKIYLASESEMNDLEKLETELQKKNPNKSFVKKAMDTTFLQRRKWIEEECPPVQEILIKYPIFKKSKYVSTYVYSLVRT